MSLLATNDQLARVLSGLGPYLVSSLERAARLALHQHAEELSIEHALASLLEDEDCAASQLVQHAFADPETIAAEALALSTGIMVVGSERCIAFSMRGARALEDARADAVARRNAAVTPTHLFAAAAALLDDDLDRAVRAAGFDPGALTYPEVCDEEAIAADGPLLRHFSNDARRALGSAGRWAHSLGRDAIAPAHLMAGAVDVDEALRAESALTRSRMAHLAAGRDADTTPVPERPLAPDAALADLLAALPPGAGTLEFLAEVAHSGSDELRMALQRQRITRTLLESSRDAFRDPGPDHSSG